MPKYFAKYHRVSVLEGIDTETDMPFIGAEVNSDISQRCKECRILLYINKAFKKHGKICTTLRAQIFVAQIFAEFIFVIWPHIAKLNSVKLIRTCSIAKVNSVKFSKFQSIAKICSAKLKEIVLLFFVKFCSVWPISTNTMFKIATIRNNHVNLSERQLL